MPMSDQRPPERPFRKNGRPQPNGGGGGMRVGRGLMGWVLFIALGIMLVVLLQHQGRTYTTISYNPDFTNLLKANDIKSMTIDGDEGTGELKMPQQIGVN